jgi:hypothetical protein
LELVWNTYSKLFDTIYFYSDRRFYIRIDRDRLTF